MPIDIEGDGLFIEREDCNDRIFSPPRAVKRFVAVESTFIACKFDNLKLNYACFGAGGAMAEYIDCTFDGSRIKSVTPGRARFVRCQFRNVHLSLWLCQHVEMVDCVFTGELSEVTFNAQLSPADQKKLGRSSNEYRNNDFSGARFKFVAFRGGVDFSDQVLPTGAGYVRANEINVRSAIERVSLWKETEQRISALASLEVMLENLMEGQREVLVSPDDKLGLNAAEQRAHERLIGELDRVIQK